jgi:hypothetical protein
MLDEPLTTGDSFTADNTNVIAWQDADTVTVNGSSYAITAVKPDADFICLPDHRPPPNDVASFPASFGASLMRKPDDLALASRNACVKPCATNNSIPICVICPRQTSTACETLMRTATLSPVKSYKANWFRKSALRL